MYVLADLVTQWGPQADFAEGGEETKVGRGFVTLPQVSAKSRAESGPYRPPSNRPPPPQPACLPPKRGVDFMDSSVEDTFFCVGKVCPFLWGEKLGLRPFPSF